ncbi:hypothetical protein C8R46DRAFT_1122771 [Mycena filopes]|nr:hypothetical protein C8R46DRAFT_1122771 [Mycena filopes]
MAALSKAAIASLVTYIKSPHFPRPRIPPIPDNLSSHSDIYFFQGKRLYDYAIFKAMGGTCELLKMPVGFSAFLDTMLLLKLDSNALDKVTGVRKGLFAYIGGHWNGVDCDDEETIGCILPILRPLAQHVGQFYTEKFVKPNTRGTRANQVDPSALLKNLQSILTIDSSSDSSLDSSLSNMSITGDTEATNQPKPSISIVARPDPDIPPFDSWVLSPLHPGVLARPITPMRAIHSALDGLSKSPLRPLELPSPSGIEEELARFNGRYDGGDFNLNHLLPAFEMESRKANAAGEHPATGSGSLEVHSSPAKVSPIHRSGSACSEIDGDGFNVFLDFSHFQSPEKSPSSVGVQQSARRPLTPRNNASRVSEVGSAQGKGKEREELW